MSGNSALRILIVEDDPPTRTLLRETLERDGHGIDEAGSIAEALDRSGWSEYLAVLIDHRLPDGEGEQLLPHLARVAPGAATIIVTGYADIHGAISAFRLGAIDYLLKPIDPDALRSQIEQIADQRRTRSALDASQERLRLILECDLLGIASFSRDGQITEANDEFLRMVGYRREELTSRQVRWDSLTPAQWQARTREADAELESTGRVRPYLREFFHRDGHRFWGLLGEARFADDSGGVAFLLDTTDLCQAQEKVMKAERLAAVGEAMTGLIHEGRNALQRGQACLELLALLVKDRPGALDLIDRVQAAQSHLHELYEDIRGYAAPIALAYRECNLRMLWRDAWATLHNLRRARTVSLLEEAEESVLAIVADPGRLAQVFRNLFENALAASPDPVEVKVRARPSELAGRPAARIEVRDNGPGFTEDQRSRAFEPFYTTKTKGTGLGLPTAQRIVEAHGGQIVIGDAPGPGAEIRITLPLNGP